ncbi:MAG: alpha/beta hydrolase fold domain-containing protein [Sarcina sp.]|uniref:alpha/beta hydrolase fold domain-containing protein n=1 Tax=Clostridium sp. TaxID=1506 RepID=UPI003F2F7DD7
MNKVEVIKRSLSGGAVFNFLKVTRKNTPLRKEVDLKEVINKLSKSGKDYMLKHHRAVKMTEEYYINKMKVYSINNKNDKQQRVILYLHGGAYIMDPMKYHFDTVYEMAKKLDARVIFPIYFKTPEYTYKDSFRIILEIYRWILKNSDNSSLVTIMGDSAGGGFALSLAQKIRDVKLDQPKDIILMSPWLDIETKNPEIENFQSKDVVLNSIQLNKLGKLWAGDTDLKDPLVSPIYGTFNDLGKISLVVGTDEIFYPDVMKLHEILDTEEITHNTLVFEEMFHDFEITPTIEGNKARKRIEEIIRS